ncbi:DEAD/DEAH box helicase [Bdellovibrio reynosensis]|uniref:DEAD/DEAH box helicase n=1 Tax=Bdellovibrio reynosensis TaxID=2835041 RepID=A0ABY4C8V2_9BACT|nr:DEAD/DEAH box helicase [Bdellovibrio reynosensis]UOF00106.1 DEAD/DEAH box helicase [Bdellovibrio reynosensis]
MNTFPDFGLLPSLIKTLKTLKIYTPTEIQRNAIPLLMSGQSVVGVSETGSGKTLTYALPILHLLKSFENEGNSVTEAAMPRAIVLVPSRDLGEQVSKVFKQYTHDTRLRVRPVLGGTTFEQSRRSIEGAFEILLATPGRLTQLMEKDLINFSDVRMIVFDEADQMLDDGFLTESEMIVKACPDDIPLALFSATVSKRVQELMTSLFEKAEVVRSSGAGKVVKTLKTKNETVIDGLRWPIFEKLLKQKPEGGTIVFTNTREQCDKLAAEIEKKGFACVVYRGEMDKGQRRSNLNSFRKGEVNLLVSTDLAARGLDLDHVGRVINFHLPQDMENYLHRAGRTARAGKEGLVVNLVTERDLNLIAKLEGKGVKELKTRFKDKNGKRLHAPEELRKPKVAKAKTKSAKPAQENGAKAKPGFKPKFKPKSQARSFT